MPLRVTAGVGGPDSDDCRGRGAGHDERGLGGGIPDTGLSRVTQVCFPLGESWSHSEDDVDIPLSRAPVRDGRTKRDLARVDRGAEVHSAVRNDRLTEPPIDFVEFAVRDSTWAIAKAHDV